VSATTAYPLLLCLCCAWAPSFQARPSQGGVEQSIAGLRVGDPVSKAKRLFPRLTMTGGQGVWTADIARNCRIEAVAGGENGEPDARIEVITLERIDVNDGGRDDNCDSFRTGAGLRFGAGLVDVERFYKGIPLMEQGKEPAVYRRQNGPECLTGRSSVLRSMYIYWAVKMQRIESITLEASRVACEEYRDYSRSK
jgi:hypothetical protein